MDEQAKPKNKKRRRRRTPSESASPIQKSMTPIYEAVAGVDIGSKEHYVAVQVGEEYDVRTFGCLTPELLEMANWLKENGIRTVVMESTGKYWFPVFQILEDQGLVPVLVDARYARNLPGRKKTDVKDSCWLQKLYSYGMLKPCFIPKKDMAEIRTYWRQRAAWVQNGSSNVLLMHGAMEVMNIQLHKELSDVTGLSGMAILRAIIDGERDPRVLAKLRHRRVKASEEEIINALTGNYRPEHVFALKQAVEAYDFAQTKIKECDAAIQAALATYAENHKAEISPAAESNLTDSASDTSLPSKDLDPSVLACVTRPIRRRLKKAKGDELHLALREYLIEITGVDLSTIDGVSVMTALTVLSECGFDLSAFPDEDHFASYLGLCPNNRVTGGKVKSSRTNRNHHRAAQALRLAAQSLWRSKSALGAFYRTKKGRIGTPAAITATAHKLARLIYRMIKYGQDYVDLGQEWYQEQYERQCQQRLAKQAKRMGCSVTNLATGEIYC